MVGPKILMLDIETAPTIAGVWRMFKENVSIDQIHEDWFIMSYAAKWLNDDGMIYNDCRNHVGNDMRLLGELWSLLDEADWVVAHNGCRFDLPKIRARMLMNRLAPFSPVKCVDTLELVKRGFAMTSNKLEYLASRLTRRKKLKHNKFPGYTLWKECMAGNNDAWDEMQRYNEEDVRALEAVYLRLVPWAGGLPNHGVHRDGLDGVVCPRCGGVHLVKRGVYTTKVAHYQRYRCDGCGGWSRGRQVLVNLDKRKHILMEV